MLVILSICWCIPTASALHKLFITSRKQHSWLPTLVAALCGGFFLTGPLVSVSIVKNRSLTQYHFLGDNEAEIIKLIQEHAGDGRVLFSGCVTHEFNHGHIAPLSVLTNKPLIASSPVHDIWWYTPVFPRDFLKAREEGITRYLDLHNVSIIFAHENEWKRFFSRQPESYEKIWESNFDWSSGPLRLYRRLNFRSDYVLEGAATINEIGNQFISLIPKTEELVLKFNYFPFLTSNNCQIQGEKVSDTITFIKLTQCRVGEQSRIESISPLRRSLPGKYWQPTQEKVKELTASENDTRELQL